MKNREIRPYAHAYTHYAYTYARGRCPVSMFPGIKMRKENCRGESDDRRGADPAGVPKGDQPGHIPVRP